MFAMNGPPQTQANPPEIVYVSFSAEVSPHTTESLLAVMANCVNQKVKTIYLLLSTPGGSVMNGLNIYNVLVGMPFELITHRKAAKPSKAQPSRETVEPPSGTLEAPR